MDRRECKEYISVLGALVEDQINKPTNNAANSATNAVGLMESRLNSLHLIRSMTHGAETLYVQGQSTQHPPWQYAV